MKELRTTKRKPWTTSLGIGHVKDPEVRREIKDAVVDLARPNRSPERVKELAKILGRSPVATHIIAAGDLFLSLASMSLDTREQAEALQQAERNWQLVSDYADSFDDRLRADIHLACFDGYEAALLGDAPQELPFSDLARLGRCVIAPGYHENLLTPVPAGALHEFGTILLMNRHAGKSLRAWSSNTADDTYKATDVYMGSFPGSIVAIQVKTSIYQGDVAHKTMPIEEARRKWQESLPKGVVPIFADVDLGITEDDRFGLVREIVAEFDGDARPTSKLDDLQERISRLVECQPIAA